MDIDLNPDTFISHTTKNKMLILNWYIYLLLIHKLYKDFFQISLNQTDYLFLQTVTKEISYEMFFDTLTIITPELELVL